MAAYQESDDFLEPQMLRLALTTASYMGLLTLLAVATPGVGLVGVGISIVPDHLRGWAHVPMYGGLAWLVIYSARARGWPVASAVIVGVAFSMTFGVWMELAQISAPGREPSIEDLLFDGLGVIMAALCAVGFATWRITGWLPFILGFKPAALSHDRSAR